MDAMSLLTTAFDKIEIRTAFTDPVVVNLKGPPDPRSIALLKEIQPVIVFSGPLGRIQIAPAGVPTGKSPLLKRWGWGLAIGGAGVALGLIFIGGALGSRRPALSGFRRKRR